MRKRAAVSMNRVGGYLGAMLGLGFVLVSPEGALSLTITFDDTPPAPSGFAAVIPGGGFGPALDFGDVTLNGGVIGLAIAPGDLAATTPPNFYATTDFLPLADGTLLPGEISAVLATPVGSVSLDVGNGNLFASEFTLTATTGAGVVSTTVLLDAFGAGSGSVGQLEVAAAGITGFSVTSGQPAGSKLFSIDTLVLAVPEPTTGLLFACGLIGLAWTRRQGPIRKTRPQSRSGWVRA